MGSFFDFIPKTCMIVSMSKKNQLLQRVKGILFVHHRGFGFLQPEERKHFQEDIFIPAFAINGAVSGDRVEIEVSPFLTEKGPEGRVVKILKRGRTHLAAILCELTPQGRGWAYAPLLGEERIELLPFKGLKRGERLLLEVMQWATQRQHAVGKIVQQLGHISDASKDVEAAIVEFELSNSFAKKSVEEAGAFGSSVRSYEKKKRVDFTNLECFTIDPETAKDFDDALSLSLDSNGIYHLGVHIADVSHYVKPHSALDQEAKTRSLSVYFPGFVVPMLPHELSSHLCSLKPGVNRLAISLLLDFDAEGNLLDYRIERSLIRSQKRFSYVEAKEILDGRRKSRHAATLFLMVDLCHRLKKKRAERGSIDFALPDLLLTVDANGEPQNLEIVQYDITHQLVEEFMLKANEVVATHLTKQGKPLAYRIHEEPNAEHLREFAALAKSFGFTISSAPTAAELQLLFDEVRGHPAGQFLTTAFIRSMKLAAYSTQNVGHYGLRLEHYTHFTSPIRRYIDLIVHRLLFNEMEPRTVDLEALALACSERERHAARAEQSLLSLKKLRLLERRKKEEPNATYEALITQIKPSGFVFEVPEFMYEGFMHSAEPYKTGDRIQLLLNFVDLIFQKTDWTLVHSKKRKRKR
jgi:ribonuclease R